MAYKVLLQTWALDATKRRSLALDPARVDVIEHYQDAYGTAKGFQTQVDLWWGEPGHDSVPTASRIIMQGKQEYLVQGRVDDVLYEINLALTRK
ncbi:MAG: hypothetical protein WAK55_32960 [Xanthobacteraceae bacterium]